MTAVPFRRLIERRIARHAIKACIASGYLVEVNDGETDVLPPCKDVKAIMDAMFSTDMDRLYIFRDGAERPFGWILFVYGNDGWDVISDHTVNLEDVLKPTNEWATRIESKYFRN